MYGLQITTANGTCEWKRHVDQIIAWEREEERCENNSPDLPTAPVSSTPVIMLPQ
jgi:hypothetical protein